MCGIAGVYDFSGGGTASLETARRMCDRLLHRGPDGRGEYGDPSGRLALGHTRLSIIDLESGGQPMASADGSLVISFNGEIYNHLELRARCGGRTFRTRSDTEVILHLYAQLGMGAFPLLRGMFAIALWCAPAGRLILARDRLGIKPLYYASLPGRLVFASEAQAVLEAGGVGRDVDPQALREYLAIRAVPAPRTMFRDVSKLEPGTVLVCDTTGPARPRPFWRLEATRPDAVPTDEETAVRAVREGLQDAVASHMLSDVPVGALLSGGVDSSMIVSAMRRYTDAPLDTFSVGFPDEGYDEFPYARQVSRLCRTRHHEYVVTPQEFVRSVPDLVRRFADPVADPAAVPLYFIARLAREHGIKVLLSGEGSDELFAGYPDYLAYLGGAGPAGPLRRLARTLRRLAGRTRRRGDRFYRGHSGLGDPGLVDRLVPGTGEASALDICHTRAVAARLDRLQTMLAIDLTTRIPEDLLCRTDRMTMAHSVEARVPFLDHGFVELGFWLPSALKIQRGVPKYVLKRAAEAWLPRSIIYRRKMGFPTPIRRWLSGDLQPLFRYWLLEEREEPALLDYEALGRLVEQHFAGRRDVSLLLWRVWFFKLWFAHWVRGGSLEVRDVRNGSRASPAAASRVIVS